MSARRTFGWIQNPGDLMKLKRVVAVLEHSSDTNTWMVNERLPLLRSFGLISDTDCEKFIDKLSETDIEVSCALLKGKGAGSGGRKNALCTGIFQAAINAQQEQEYTDAAGKLYKIKKPYTDDWTAEGYLRWAVSCGLLEYDRHLDQCKISGLGKELVHASDNSQEEKEAFTKALLSYPPVIRILALLSKQDEQTKFELGSKLGFSGEAGFSSFPQNIYACDYCEAGSSAEKSKVRSNEEGDSDKYARGIASWLAQMGWVTTDDKEVTEAYRKKTYRVSLQTYTITRAGEKALVRARGNSSNPRLERIVMFEMLASNKTPGADYIRYQRACLLRKLSGNRKSLKQLQNALSGYELELSENAIRDHIEGLISIGLEIEYREEKYKLLDKISGLVIPERSKCVKDELNDIKDRVRDNLKYLDHKYLVLIDLAYSDASSKTKKNADAREFEIRTAELFTQELSFQGMRLGDANKPDVIIFYDTYGTIIDNKSYKDGLNIDKHCADEMSRYINENQQRMPGIPANEWWKSFDAKVTDFTFLFVTSYLKGRFENQIEYISKTHGGIRGAAIGVESLLYLAEKMKSGRMNHKDFYDDFYNGELIYTF